MSMLGSRLSSWSVWALWPRPFGHPRGYIPQGRSDPLTREMCLVGRKPWRALWADALRSSPKWSRLTLTQRGFWLECFLMAKADGRLLLRPGVPLSITDLAYECRCNTNRLRACMDALIRTGLAVDEGGCFRLTKMSEMSLSSVVKHPSRTKDDSEQNEHRLGRSSGINGLQQNYPARERREEKKGTAGPASSRAVPPAGDAMTDADYARRCRENSARRQAAERKGE